MRMVSYAQNAEDVVLSRAFPTGEGFYVDVGANDPTHDSVTRHFYDRGWSGVNIEPQTGLFDALTAMRPRDVNLNVGVGARPDTLDFFVVPDAQAMSSFSAEHARRLNEQGYRTERLVLAVRTLVDIFAEHVGTRTVDFLKVDVEGFEEDVLGGFDWEMHRPRVVVVESGRHVPPWEQRMLEAGYSRTLWDGINVFLVRSEDQAELSELLSAPATLVLDRYDPLLYLEQFSRYEDRVVQMLGAFLFAELRLLAPPGTDVDSLSRALARCLVARPDVLAAFGEPPATDVAGLVAWAATAAGGGEPSTEHLAPVKGSLGRLAAAVGVSRP